MLRIRIGARETIIVKSLFFWVEQREREKKRTPFQPTTISIWKYYSRIAVREKFKFGKLFRWIFQQFGHRIAENAMNEQKKLSLFFARHSFCVIIFILCLIRMTAHNTLRIEDSFDILKPIHGQRHTKTDRERNEGVGVYHTIPYTIYNTHSVLRACVWPTLATVNCSLIHNMLNTKKKKASTTVNRLNGNAKRFWNLVFLFPSNIFQI